MNRRLTTALTIVTAALLMSGCSATASVPGKPIASNGTTPVLSGVLTIFAAASLTASFDKLAAAFSADNPVLELGPIVYDGSSTLATQLKEGATADVFASADKRTMAEVADVGLLAGPSSTFASNILEIAVQPGNPHGIHSLTDLAQGGLLVVLCAPQVPCGAAARTLLSLAGASVTPVSEEQNVTAVLTKVRLGEADAGLVYSTDVTAAAGAVDGIAVSGAERAVNDYEIGIPTDAPNPTAAKAFVRWVLSAKGQAILAGFGFGRP